MKIEDITTLQKYTLSVIYDIDYVSQEILNSWFISYNQHSLTGSPISEDFKNICRAFSLPIYTIGSDGILSSIITKPSDIPINIGEVKDIPIKIKEAKKMKPEIGTILINNWNKTSKILGFLQEKSIVISTQWSDFDNVDRENVMITQVTALIIEGVKIEKLGCSHYDSHDIDWG